MGPVPVDEYLDGESRAERKHEYIDGVVYAMVGATNAHNLVATNITGLLHAQLRGKTCQVFNADAKVRVRLPSGTRFYYPDASVVCQPNQPGDAFNDAAVVYRRGDAGFAREVFVGRDAVIPLPEVGCELRLADVYANVALREP